MFDGTINSIDKSLAMLLKTEHDFPNYNLDICTGYISASGVMLIKNMLSYTPRTRAIIGLSNSNKVSALQMLSSVEGY